MDYGLEVSKQSDVMSDHYSIGLAATNLRSLLLSHSVPPPPKSWLVPERAEQTRYFPEYFDIPKYLRIIETEIDFIYYKTIQFNYLKFNYKTHKIHNTIYIAN